MDVGEGLAVYEAPATACARVVGATVDVVMDVGEGLAVDEALPTIGAEYVGAADDVGA